MVSLLKDFVESEFFLIDGDSLLIDCFLNVNFKKGQTLHFFYIVERFLHDFIQKEAKFVLVFFKHEIQLQHALHAYIIEYDQRSLEREIFLYGHLKLNLGEMQKEIHQTLSLFLNRWPEGADVRSVVCSISCAVTLKHYKKILHDAQDYENLNICTENHNTQDLKKPLTLKEAADLCRMHCLSVIFLQRLPLFQRAKSRIITYTWDRTLVPFLKMLKRCQFFILKHLKARNNWNVNFTGLPDLTDSSLWKNIAYYYEIEHNRGLNLELGNTLKQGYEELWNTVLTLSEDDDFGGSMPVRTTSRPFLTQKKTSPRVPGSNQGSHKLGLIPLKAEIIEDYAGDILSELPFLSSDDPAVTSLSKKKEFDELTHWHSSRPLSDDFERTKCNSDAKSKDAKGIRDMQKLHHFYHVFGKSLVGSNKSIRITGGSALPPPENSSVQKKKKHQTNAEKFIEENQKRQLAKLEKKEEERWKNLSVYIEKEMKENPNSGIKKLEDFLQTCPVKSVKFAAEMVGLDACFKLWMECCSKPETESKDMNIIINLMKRIHIIHEKHSELLKNTDRRKLAKYLKYVGFDNLAHSLYPQRELLDVVDNNESAVIVAPTSSGKTYASYYCMEKILRESDEGVIVYVAPTKVQESSTEKDISKYSVCMGAARFQLTYMGHYLLREERSDPDPRVHHFIPDTWQRELLDVVDNNESAVIVAPTSSGKTYASYYCMEKILRESDEGVIVYVAPTKALVNQVVGTICSLFTKALPKGLVVCGVFTRDYRHDTLNCQELEPEEFSCFKNKIVITRADAKKYEEELKKEIIHWSQLDPSKVILDDLPKEFAAVVEEHNTRIQEYFGSFLLTISKLADMRKESQLPLSEIDFSGKECEDSELVSHLMPGTESRTAVSPFACLSNITDQDLFDVDVINDVRKF
ncbi:Putative ATP-dependent RNA helicase DDX60 [Myotis davidii]|uniref:Putative ATP-dependent RNA helicase DDX60 n=1 Tax=Myotis davidii TaxID=225400 RepID=L5MF96_MYODS|nr:Putative ATP-dependent RNA helicase DDX60 [Myotis davidii]